MKRVYNFTLIATLSSFTGFALMSGIINDWTVPVWAIALFVVFGYVVARMLERRKRIRIKYFVRGIEPVRKIAVGDWIDLRAAESIALTKGDLYHIRLGVGMVLPAGYEALILPRSSTPLKFGIVCANSMGVIDNSYSGDADEWHFPAIAIRDTVIEKGDRIAQFRIIENQPRITFDIVSNMNPTSRGGFGSTGTR